MKVIVLIPILFSFILLSGCMKEYDRADFLLPREVAKDFVLLLGEECGENVPVVNGRKQYQIRQDGLLIVQNKFKNLPIDYKFYWIDDNDIKEEIEINYYRESDGRPYPGVRILGHSEINGKLNQSTDCLSFIILYSESDDKYEFLGKKDELYEKEIIKCRKLIN